MPPTTAAQPRAARQPRGRKVHRYNVAGVVEFDEAGVNEAAARILRLVEKLKDPNTIKAAAQPVYEAEKRLFAAHGAGHWKPTKRETTAEKRAKGLRTEPMRATDRTLRSLTMPPSQLPAGEKRYGLLTTRKRNTELRIGSKTPGAIFQNREGRVALIVDEQGRRDVAEVVRRALLS